MIRQVFNLFTKREKLELFGIFLLLLFMALLETTGVGVIYPFIQIVINPESIHENQILKKVYETLQMSSEQNFLIICGIGWFLLVIIKNGYYILNTKIQASYLNWKQACYSSRVYKSYLQHDYTFHLEHNSAKLQHNIGDVDKIFIGYIMPIFQIIPEILITIFLVAMLIYTNYWVTIAAVLLVGLPSWASAFFTGKVLMRLGEDYYKGCREVSKILLEGLINIKEIQVMNREKFFFSQYFNKALKLSHVRKKQAIVPQIPRLVIETFVIGTLILLIIIVILFQETLIGILPIIALFSAATWRLMSSLSRIVYLVNQIKSNLFAINSRVIPDLQQLSILELDEDIQNNTFSSLTPKLPFNKEIKIDKISYCYQGANKSALHQVPITIPKGTSIAFVGKTGAGKTTLVDIILGLLIPTEGKVFVDAQNIYEHLTEWRNCIGYIPQAIHLSDDTLRRNIAFGFPDELIDEQAILKTIEIAQLKELVEELPQGLNTVIGEQGSRLSGGQRQRIAVARALYHDPQILIMDEATSALDGDTENEVIKAIDQLSGKKTLIIIAHRLTTVKKCNCIYLMENAEIKDRGTYEELLKKNSQFRKIAGFEESI